MQVDTRGAGRKPGASFTYGSVSLSFETRVGSTGGRATNAWCLVIHAEASLSTLTLRGPGRRPGASSYTRIRLSPLLNLVSVHFKQTNYKLVSSVAFNNNVRPYAQGHLFKKRAPQYIMTGADSSVPASFHYTCPIEDCSDVTRFFTEDPGKNTAATTVTTVANTVYEAGSSTRYVFSPTYAVCP